MYNNHDARGIRRECKKYGIPIWLCARIGYSLHILSLVINSPVSQFYAHADKAKAAKDKSEQKPSSLETDLAQYKNQPRQPVPGEDED